MFPIVSRDGSWIAFTSDGAVHVARFGEAARAITDPGKDIDAFPDWSPDGSRIVFARSGKGQFDPSMLYVAAANGTGLDQLTAGDPPLGERAPSWSPNADKIAFERFGLKSNVYTIDVEGRNERLLLRDAGEPAWSPDGSKIAFVRGSGDGIGVFDLETRTSKEVIGSKLGAAEDPAWSPDGRQIAFADTPSDYPEIYVVNADGTGLRRLTRSPEVEGMPTWTRDGRIIFARGLEGAYQLYVMHRDGTGVRRFRFPAD